MTSGSKPCIYCGEQIRPDAKKCRYCGEWFETSEPTSQPAHAAAPSVSAPTPSPPASPRPRTSGRAIASFLFAVLGGGLGAIPAIVLSNQARREIKGSGGSVGGKGWAEAGYYLGLAQLIIIGLVLIAIGLANGSSSSSSSRPAPSLPPATPDGPVPVYVKEGAVSATATKRGDVLTIDVRVPQFGFCDVTVYAPSGRALKGTSRPILEKGLSQIDMRGPWVPPTGYAELECSPF